jgi:ABC-type polysaccharide/polyol phosphate export permease
MTTFRAHISAASAICRRDMLIYLSYRGLMATQVLSIIITLVMFYYISRLIGDDRFRSATAYFSYVVVGIVIADSLQAAAAAALSLHTQLLTGTFERLVCSPFGAVNGIASSMLFPILMQLISAVVTLTIGGLAFGMPIIWSSAPLAIPLALACALTFSSIALFGAAAMLIAKQSGTVTAYGTTILGLLGGVYFPTQLLPGWAQSLARLQPLTYLAQLTRNAVTGYPLQNSATSAIIHILGFIMIATPLAYIVLRSAMRFTQRHATLLEY